MSTFVVTPGGGVPFYLSNLPASLTFSGAKNRPYIRKAYMVRLALLLFSAKPIVSVKSKGV
jgi:hypothetical protein